MSWGRVLDQLDQLAEEQAEAHADEDRVTAEQPEGRVRAEKSFDAVSVQEIADAAEVSKMTVFNYLGTEEDLVFRPIEDHFSDAARAVRDRAPGESAVAAVRLSSSWR